MQERGQPMQTLEFLAFREMLQQLPDAQREAVMLHYWDGLSASKIGQILNTSEQAVWTSLSRTRATLRTLLGDNEQKGGAQK